MLHIGSVVNRSSILLLTVVVLVTQLYLAQAVPGTYETRGILKNKWLPNYMEAIEQVLTLEDCKAICIKNNTCTGFAYSSSYSKCLLYEIKPGTPPVQNSGYDIYIKLYSESEGYHIYETGYIRLMLERKSAAEAKHNCTEQGGDLVAVRDKKLNDLLWARMVTHNIWHAYIGLSDQEEEGDWKWPDGGGVGYQNWDWNGKWYRKDRNCAVIINGFEGAPWKQVNCKINDYYFCQIPMF